MKEHWEKIDFKPADFNVPDDDEEGFDGTDIIKENGKFTPPHKKPSEHQEKSETKLTGVGVKNLPHSIPEEEITMFLESNGLPKGHKFSVIRNPPKNTNVDIDNLDNSSCNEIIEKLNKKLFFNMTIYCRGVENLETPTKKTKETVPNEEQNTTEKQKVTTTSSSIPGLPTKEEKKARKKAAKKLKREQKIQKEEASKNNADRSTFLKDTEHSKTSLNDSKDSPNKDTDTSSDDEDSDSDQAYSTPTYTPKPGFFEQSPLCEPTDPLLSSRRFSSNSAKAIEKELWKLCVEKNNKRANSSPPADQNAGKVQRTRSLSSVPRFVFKKRDTCQAEKVFNNKLLSYSCDNCAKVNITKTKLNTRIFILKHVSIN